MDPLTEHLLAPGLAPVLDTARRVGLLDALLPEAQPARELAARLDLDPEATELVLDVLAALGQCRRDARGYAAVPRAYGAWPFDRLEVFLRRGERPLQLDHQPNRASLYARVVDELASRAEAFAAEAAAALPEAGRVLDVGAGSGVWSLAMAARTPSARVVGLDLPEVVPRFLARAAAMGLADRVRAVPGSWESVEPEGPFDRVVFGNVLHLEAPDAARTLLHRFARHLAPGGDIVVVDHFPARQADALAGAFYSLHLRMRTTLGRVHPAGAVAAWCAEVGLPRVEIIRAAAAPAVGALWARAAG